MKRHLRLNIFSYNIFLRIRIYTAVPVTSAAIATTKPNPYGFESRKGTLTFIPQKLAIIVGIAKIIVIDVKNFMTIFKLFEIMDANVSVRFVRILLYISTI